ncbi:uncharacterized protein DFL_002076 [Arthrobotrys flagrans]|uniref:ACB domain-containing protein n=1 Tax=Arthrobotrys flagrans TaxID=97331 RepID=A0A437A9N0_ARTFL|nr:hypothetical protein DFL_002076 [Arthrobotrys flagrans]
MPSAEFEAAAAAANAFTKKPSDDEMLKLYALYKQATVGDVNTERPGMFDLKGKYKWDAWKSEEGKSQADAETEYIAYVEGLKASFA